MVKYSIEAVINGEKCNLPEVEEFPDFGYEITKKLMRGYVASFYKDKNIIEENVQHVTYKKGKKILKQYDY